MAPVKSSWESQRTKSGQSQGLVVICEESLPSHKKKMKLDSSSEEEAADVGSVQSADPQSSTSETSSDSGVSMKSDKSNHRLIDFSVKLDSSSEEEAADVGSVQPPDYQSFMRRHRRKSKSPLLNFKEGSSHMPEGPDMVFGPIHHHPFQFPFPPLSTESFKSCRRLRSNSLPPDFKEGSSHISDTESKASSTAMEVPKLPTAIMRPGGPDMVFGPIHHHPFLSPDPPKRDKVIQETNDGSGTETLLKNPPSWTSADWPVVDTRLVLQREQQLREREQQLWEREREREQQLWEREQQLREREREQQLWEREQQLWEREQQLWEREQLLREREQQLLLRLRWDSDSPSEAKEKKKKKEEMMKVKEIKNEMVKKKDEEEKK